MKKILLAFAIVSVAVSSAFAQGTVYTLNSGNLISTNGSSAGGGTGVTQGNGFYYAIFVDASTPTSANPLSGGWTYGGATMTNLNNGLENGGSAEVVNGWAANTFYNYEIVGWSTDGGIYSTWASVAAVLQNGLTGRGMQGGSYYGISATGNAEPGGGTPALPVWHLFGANTSAQGTPVPGFQLNYVQAVPEPGTLALAALGGASLLLFRRKK